MECVFPGCDRPRYGRKSHCKPHNKQIWRGQSLRPLREHRDIRCTAPDCDRPHYCKRYCSSHYEQHIKGRPIGNVRRWIRQDTCSFSGCENPAVSNELCGGHYTQLLAGKSLAELHKGIWQVCSNDSAHKRVKNLWGSPSQYPCAFNCGQYAQDWALDRVNATDLIYSHLPRTDTWSFHSRFPEDYMPLCKKCHMGLDRGLAKIELYNYRTLLVDSGLDCEEIRERLGLNVEQRNAA